MIKFDGIRHQLSAFAMGADQPETNVSVKLSLMDGSLIRLIDIVFTEPLDGTPWTLLRSRSMPGQGAVIREEHVIRVDFEIPENIQDQRIGFAAERSPKSGSDQ